jgi:hypothetical protein
VEISDSVEVDENVGKGMLTRFASRTCVCVVLFRNYSAKGWAASDRCEF